MECYEVFRNVFEHVLEIKIIQFHFQIQLCFMIYATVYDSWHILVIRKNPYFILFYVKALIPMKALIPSKDDANHSI